MIYNNIQPSVLKSPNLSINTYCNEQIVFSTSVGSFVTLNNLLLNVDSVPPELSENPHYPFPLEIHIKSKFEDATRRIGPSNSEILPAFEQLVQSTIIFLKNKNKHQFNISLSNWVFDLPGFCVLLHAINRIASGSDTEINVRINLNLADVHLNKLATKALTIRLNEIFATLEHSEANLNYSRSISSHFGTLGFEKELVCRNEVAAANYVSSRDYEDYYAGLLSARLYSADDSFTYFTNALNSVDDEKSKKKLISSFVVAMLKIGSFEHRQKLASILQSSIPTLEFEANENEMLDNGWLWNVIGFTHALQIGNDKQKQHVIKAEEALNKAFQKASYLMNVEHPFANLLFWNVIENRGRLLEMTGRVEQAYQEFCKVHSESHHLHPLFPYRKAMLKLAMHSHDEAVKFLEEAQEMCHPQNWHYQSQILHALGYVAQKIDKFETALNYFLKGIKIGEKYLSSRILSNHLANAQHVVNTLNDNVPMHVRPHLRQRTLDANRLPTPPGNRLLPYCPEIDFAQILVSRATRLIR